MLEKLSLENKTVVITGGGTGLGKEMCLAMAQAGADLVIAARRLEPIEEVSKLVFDDKMLDDLEPNGNNENQTANDIVIGRLRDLGVRIK